MKIITFAATKGGVGKTTLAYNYAEWLAEHKQVLVQSSRGFNFVI